MLVGKDFVKGQYVVMTRPDEFMAGDNVRVGDFCRITSACEIGNNCELAAGSYVSGGFGRHKFTLGNYSSLASGSQIWLSANEYVNELVAHNVDFVKEVEGDVIFGDYTGLGANSVILPNNKIPTGTVIGALSLVPSNFAFEEWTVYAGNPIKKIKKRNKENILKTLEKLNNKG